MVPPDPLAPPMSDGLSLDRAVYVGFVLHVKKYI